MKNHRFVSLMATAALAGGVILSPAQAQAAEAGPIPAGVVQDGSFQANQPTIVVGENGMTSRSFCPDRAFTAVVTLSTSVPGCNVIGTAASAKVTYKWYKHMGNSNPCIWGKGFDSKAKPAWTELGCGTGRTKAVGWGKVAASKQIRGLTGVGWAGVQWS